MVCLLIMINLKPSLLAKRRNYTNEKIQISNEDIQIVQSAKLLRITIDDRLNFNEHISNICKSAAN